VPAVRLVLWTRSHTEALSLHPALSYPKTPLGVVDSQVPHIQIINPKQLLTAFIRLLAC